jgi:hypothetical protein
LSNFESTIGAEGGPMKSFDPVLLRKLAATYRRRAREEPEQKRVFLEIARDMETHAELIETNPSGT